MADCQPPFSDKTLATKRKVLRFLGHQAWKLTMRLPIIEDILSSLPAMTALIRSASGLEHWASLTFRKEPFNAVRSKYFRPRKYHDRPHKYHKLEHAKTHAVRSQTGMATQTSTDMSLQNVLSSIQSKSAHGSFSWKHKMGLSRMSLPFGGSLLL